MISVARHNPTPCVLFVLLASCALAPGAVTDARAPAAWHEARLLMGTLVEIRAEGSSRDELRRAAAAAYDEMQRLTDMMSHYDPASVVSAINRQAGTAPVPAPPELIEVLRMARRVSRATEGAFDVTIGGLGWRFDPDDPALPDAAVLAARRSRVNYRDVVIDAAGGTVFLRRPGMRLDLGGIAKLYILHAGMDVLRRHGVESAMIDGGGDLEVMGAGRERPWRIGVRHPRRDTLLGVVELREGFVVSSGDYERYIERDGHRYHHVLDARTGRPAEGMAHVTLVGRTLDQVDGYSAALMVLGYDRARALIERTPGLEGLLVAADGRIWTSPGFQRLLAPATPAD